ncbi:MULTISPECIES: nitrilase family protein [unclassified Polaribacter]|uniref:nitrilase family protein n=1 Tax=unclassified Polaribacter TaxID=196858 RepID=UPI0011BDBEE1|nr:MULTISPECIES: nitrilase family protein [unclassified Polaribacter]TXD52447.1 nitrilase family protein [Polaribacter sp. IC063]TXD61085.1 nitrilase family protein [Polaribacter sp. IC066]
MPNELHIVGIQADLFWENPSKNRSSFDEKINSLPANTDLIVLPEMFTTGFTMNPQKVAEKMDGPSITWMQKIALEKKVALTGSLVIEQNNNYYNRLVFVHPSGKTETYDKKHSFTLAGEDKVYTSGNQRLIVTYKGWKICPLICYDLRFPVWARNTENYDILIFMANWPVTRIKAWETLLKARAIENMSYVIGVNRTGIDKNNYEYSGNSLVVDYLGEELSSLQKSEVGIVTATISKANQNEIRKKLGFLNDQDAFKI